MSNKQPKEKKLDVRKIRKLAGMFTKYHLDRAETTEHEARIRQHLVGIPEFVEFIKYNWRRL